MNFSTDTATATATISYGPPPAEVRALGSELRLSIVPAGTPKNSKDSSWKCPTVKWKELTLPLTDGEMAGYFPDEAKPRNIFILTGPSDLVVFDEDQWGALQKWIELWGLEPVPATYTVRTNQGKHHYLRHDHTRLPIQSTTNLHGVEKLDVRAFGGGVIGEGSRHNSGVIYEHAEGSPREIADLPESWVRALTGPPPSRGAHQHPGGDSLMSQWAPDTTPSTSGQRNKTSDWTPEAKILWHTRNECMWAYASMLVGDGVPRDQADAKMAEYHSRAPQAKDGPCDSPGCTAEHDDYPIAQALDAVRRAYEKYPLGTPPVPAISLPPNTDDFWEARPSLQRMRQFARSYGISPWGLFGATAIYVLDKVPYNVGLPDLFGGSTPGSLNSLAALVGSPGGGKGRTFSAAREYIGHTDIDLPPGSGEGLIKQFVERLSKEAEKLFEADEFGYLSNLGPWQEIIGHPGSRFLIRKRNFVYSAPEIDTLERLAGRGGGTLDTVTRQAFSGETLGFTYGHFDKQSLVPAGAYRLGFLFGVQPERSQVLFDGEAAGTPQRIAWWPTAPEDDEDHERPRLPSLDLDRRWNPRIAVADSITTELRKDYHQRQRGHGDPLDAHLLFVQLKLAAHLAILDSDGGPEYRRPQVTPYSPTLDAGITEQEWQAAQVTPITQIRITEEDWSLAAIATEVSKRQRSICRSALSKAASERSKSIGRQEGIRKTAANIQIAKDGAERVADRLVNIIIEHGELSPGKLRNKVAQRDRKPHFDDALALVLTDGRLARQDGRICIP